jgi:hypothetical protein
MATRTLIQYQTKIGRKIGMDITDAGDLTAMRDWLNEAYEDFLLETHVNVHTGVAATSAGVGDYDLSTNILAVLEVHTVDTSGDVLFFQPVTPEEILRRRTGGVVTTRRGGYFATQGINKLMLFPTPTEAYNITFYYVPRPTALSVSSDVPSSVPAEYHKALEFYALSEAADEDDDGTSLQGDRYRLLYEGFVSKARRQKQWRGGRDFGVLRLDRRGGDSRQATNDYY